MIFMLRNLRSSHKISKKRPIHVIGDENLNEKFFTLNDSSLLKFIKRKSRNRPYLVLHSCQVRRKNLLEVLSTTIIL